MKIAFTPKIARRAVFSTLAAASLFSTPVAANNPASRTATQKEVCNIDTFQRADSNKDNVLSYSEFANIEGIKETPNTKIKKAENTERKKDLGVLIILAVMCAAIGICQDIRDGHNGNSKENGLFF